LFHCYGLASKFPPLDRSIASDGTALLVPLFPLLCTPRKGCQHPFPEDSPSFFAFLVFSVPPSPEGPGAVIFPPIARPPTPKPEGRFSLDLAHRRALPPPFRSFLSPFGGLSPTQWLQNCFARHPSFRSKAFPPVASLGGQLRTTRFYSMYEANGAGAPYTRVLWSLTTQLNVRKRKCPQPYNTTPKTNVTCRQILLVCFSNT